MSKVYPLFELHYGLCLSCKSRPNKNLFRSISIVARFSRDRLQSWIMSRVGTLKYRESLPKVMMLSKNILRYIIYSDVWLNDWLQRNLFVFISLRRILNFFLAEIELLFRNAPDPSPRRQRPVFSQNHTLSVQFFYLILKSGTDSIYL